MKITNQQLINLPVVTESGQQLGKIESFNLDIDSQSILEYNIKPSNIVKELIQGDLTIPRGQVVDISQDKIIVKDTFSKSEPLKKLNKVLAQKKSVVINKQ